MKELESELALEAEEVELPPEQSQLKKRFESLLWRISGMVGAMAITFAIENATELNIPTTVVVLLGLVNGELTKWLNKG